MLKRWIEKHFKFFGVLVLLLEAVNTWVASEIFYDCPLLALANGTMAVLITLGVILSWKMGKAKEKVFDPKASQAIVIHRRRPVYLEVRLEFTQ